MESGQTPRLPEVPRCGTRPIDNRPEHRFLNSRDLALVAKLRPESRRCYRIPSGGRVSEREARFVSPNPEGWPRDSTYDRADEEGPRGQRLTSSTYYMRLFSLFRAARFSPLEHRKWLKSCRYIDLALVLRLSS